MEYHYFFKSKDVGAQEQRKKNPAIYPNARRSRFPYLDINGERVCFYTSGATTIVRLYQRTEPNRIAYNHITSPLPFSISHELPPCSSVMVGSGFLPTFS
jgi:hypothetical protein